jgi:hypothetical protein
LGRLYEYKRQKSDQTVKDQKSFIPSFDYIRRKIFTVEDHFNVHKFFGFLSLLSFFYRYLYVFPTTGTLGFDGGWFDYVTLLVHFFLSASSLIFHVLKKRIPRNPLIIYEEYRLHTIVFTTRVVVLGILSMSIGSWFGYLEKQIFLLPYALSMHYLVDLISAKYGTPGVTTVRNDDVEQMKSVKLFYAYYQFIGLSSCILVDPRQADLAYNILIAIQSSTFLMTLKRKNLINWYSHVVWYTLALLFSMGYIFVAKGWWFFFAIIPIYLMRVRLNMSKYILWPLYVVGVNILVQWNSLVDRFPAIQLDKSRYEL